MFQPKSLEEVKQKLRELFDDRTSACLVIVPSKIENAGKQNANNPELLYLPDVWQTDHYSCGAASAMAVGRVGPETLPEWKTALGTDVEESTIGRKF